MRLLVVSQYFWPEEFRVNDFVIGMRERGHEVTVLTGLPNYPGGKVFDAYKANPQAFRLFGDVEVIRIPMLPRGSNSFTLALNYLTFAVSASLFGAWKLRDHSIDAIFVFQTSPITAALPALVLRWLKRAPVLLWILDLWPDTLEALSVVRSRRMLAVVSALVKFIYKRCDRILIQSQAFRPSVLAHGAKAEQICYFPNWIEPIFERGVQSVRPAPEVTRHGGDFVVMFTGNIGESQDMPAVVKAAAETRDLKGLRWLIVGDGRAAEDLRADVVRFGLEDRLVLLGRYPVERMTEFMAGADALLVSLRSEPVFAMTIPGKVQSYLASGLPILGMMDGEGARVVDESGGGFSSPASDAMSLADNVRRLMALDDVARAAMGRKAQTYAAEEFGRDKLFDDFVEWATLAKVQFE